MRIGLITNYYPPEVGSIAISIIARAHYLGSRGHEVFVITGHRGITYQWRGETAAFTVRHPCRGVACGGPHSGRADFWRAPK